SNLGARLVTVHASGGRTMLQRAVERARKEGDTLAICAVTVLTSLDDDDLDDIGLDAPDARASYDANYSRASAVVANLARLAWEEGVRWFVCSPAEVALLRNALGPDATLVTPGVRPASGATADQKRVATPEQAIANGASWLVVGRPIRDAENRLAAAQAIAKS